MAANNKGNLKDLLKAGGYDEGHNEALGIPSYLCDAPQPVLRRVRALKKLQLESLEIEAQFYKEVHELELKFQPIFNEMNAKRFAITNGEYEPTDNEIDVPLIHGLAPEDLEKLEQDAPVEGGEQAKGIPNFWFNVLNNVAQISDKIKEYDEAVLKYLTDITVEVHKDPAGFTLCFHFTENPFFSNKVLTKYYELELGVDQEDPFQYDGPYVTKCKGCEIEWKEGKNITQKIVKKKQKKGPHTGKFITKTVSNESFFNFFDPTPKTIEQEMDDNEEEKIREDFEIGQVIRDQIIPRAVLFFTGEASEDDMYDDFDEDEEEHEEDHSAGSDDNDEE